MQAKVRLVSFLDASLRAKGLDADTVKGEGKIAAELKRPVKAQYIRVRITQPRIVDGSEALWHIKKIRITERRPFRLGTREIGEVKSG